MKDTLRSKFNEMKVNQVIVVSIDEYAFSTIRYYACERGLVLGRVYTTQLDRNTRSVYVTRKS